MLGTALRVVDFLDPAVYLRLQCRDWRDIILVEGTKFVRGGSENKIGVLYARYDPWFSLVLFLRMSCAGYHLPMQLVALLYVLPPLSVGNGW